MFNQTANSRHHQANSPWHVLIASSLGGYFDGLDASIFGLVLYPAMSELLGTTAHSTAGLYGSFVMAAFMFGWACGAIIFGIISDYIGRIRTMIITILLYALCTGLCAASHSWQELAFYRFLVGCGIGGEIGTSVIVIAEYFKGTARLHGMSIMTAVAIAGYLTTALLNLVLGNFGWRYLFIAGVIPAFLTLYIRIKLKEPAPFHRMKSTRSSSLGNLTKGDVRNPSRERAIILPTFFEILSKENLPKTMVIMAMATSAIVNWWAALSWVPPWINQLTGTLAVRERSAALIALYLGALVFSLFGGFVVNHLGRANALRLGFIGSLASCAGMFLLIKSYSFVLLCGAFVAGCFAIMPFITLFIYVPELFATHVRGTAFGFGMQTGRIFAAIAALAGGQIISLFGGSYAIAGASIACVNVLGLLASFFMPQTTGEVALEEEVAETELGTLSQDTVPELALLSKR